MPSTVTPYIPQSTLAFFVAFHLSAMSFWNDVKQVTRLNYYGALSFAEDCWTRKRNRLDKLPNKQKQIAIVTGGARGLGAEVVNILVQCGMTVVIGVRNVKSGVKLAEELQNKGFSGPVDVQELDVSSLKSVKNFAERVSKEYPEIHLLVNNAGIMFGDTKVTEDGFEPHLATNYLGHFYLTHLLMGNLKSAGENGDACSRIVNVSSCAHFPGQINFEDINMTKDYNKCAVYSQSKLAQIMFTRYLDRLLEEQKCKVRCYSAHPGIVDTDIFSPTSAHQHARWLLTMLYKSPMEGAISVLYPCLSPAVENEGGAYYSNCAKGSTNKESKDKKLQEKLFNMTCEMVKIKGFGIVESY